MQEPQELEAKEAREIREAREVKEVQEEKTVQDQEEAATMTPIQRAPTRKVRATIR